MVVVCEGADIAEHQAQALLDQAHEILERHSGNARSSATANPLEAIDRAMFDLKKENDLIKDERSKAHNDAEHLRNKYEALAAKLQQASIEQKRYKDQKIKFLDMLNKNAGDDSEPVEREVIQSVQEIRHKILGIVHQIDKFELVRNKLENRFVGDDGWIFEKQKDIVDNWKKDGPHSQRQLLARATVFDILNMEIFSKPCFGVGGELERQLRNFERRIAEHNAG